jgi:hypothetical protein
MSMIASQSPSASEQSGGVGVVQGAPRLLLRLEGAVVLAGAVWCYAQVGAGWALFALLFLVPDLSMLGYLAGPRIGAASYNAGHSYALPAGLAGAGVLGGWPVAVSLALIWVAHIGFDRAIGYGLKYPSGFGHTHLGLPFSRSAAARPAPARA